MKEKGIKQTIRFRLYPTASQERQLHEIFAIYNRVKIGYNLYFELNTSNYTEEEKEQEEKKIWSELMQICHNNQYVNAILSENEMRLAQQQTWLKKRKKYMENQLIEIKNKINFLTSINRRDKRIRGLYRRLSSIQNRLHNLEVQPVVFGTKSLFRERVRQKISREEFIIRRDASFSCIGKVQTVNDNIKLLENYTIRIHKFRK